MKKHPILSSLTFLLASLLLITPSGNAAAQLAASDSSPQSGNIIQYRTSQKDTLTPYAPDPEKKCYHTRLHVPLTLDLSEVAQKFPDSVATLSFTFSMEVKGGRSGHSPKIKAQNYCDTGANGVSMKSCSLSGDSFKRRAEESTFDIQTQLSVPLNSNMSAVKGGICVVIETMDPLSDFDPTQPKVLTCAIQVGGEPVPIQLIQTDTLKIPDCLTCSLTAK